MRAICQVKPEIAGVPPAQPPKILVPGDVGFADPLGEPYRLPFRRGVSDWRQGHGGFENVFSDRPSPVPTDSMVLVRRSTEVGHRLEYGPLFGEQTGKVGGDLVSRP